MSDFKHYTVMLNEAVDALECTDGKIYVDCTLGGGGHTEKILENLNNIQANKQTDNNATENVVKIAKVLDDEDPSEGVPLSENIDNILSSGGSIEDALKALMED